MVSKEIWNTYLWCVPLGQRPYDYVVEELSQGWIMKLSWYNNYYTKKVSLSNLGRALLPHSHRVSVQGEHIINMYFKFLCSPCCDKCLQNRSALDKYSCHLNMDGGHACGKGEFLSVFIWQWNALLLRTSIIWWHPSRKRLRRSVIWSPCLGI